MISLDEFSEMLDVLYSASLDRDQWPRFLTLVGKHMQAGAVAFFAASSRGTFTCVEHSDSPGTTSVVESYNSEHTGTDPFRGAVVRAGRPGVYTGDELVPSAVFLRSSLYKDLLGPAQLRFATIMAVAASLRRFEAISVWRTPTMGPLEDERMRLLALLFPHVRRSLEISNTLGVAHQRMAGAKTMADASATAAFLVTRDLGVVHQNAAADSLALGGAVLEVRDGVLTTVSRKTRDTFRNLIKQTGENHGVSYHPDLNALSLPSIDGNRHMHVLVTPLPKAHREQSGGDVLVLVTDPNRPPSFPDEMLRTLFGLTVAEAEVANGLLMGYTASEIAALRKVTPGTVRLQVKTILSKTSTSRQSDLIRLLMTLPQPTS